MLSADDGAMNRRPLNQAQVQVYLVLDESHEEKVLLRKRVPCYCVLTAGGSNDVSLHLFHNKRC